MMCKNGTACKQSRHFDKSVSSPTLIKYTRASLHLACQSTESVFHLSLSPSPHLSFIQVSSLGWNSLWGDWTWWYPDNEKGDGYVLSSGSFLPSSSALVDFPQTLLVRFCCSWGVSERESGLADCWAVSCPETDSQGVGQALSTAHPGAWFFIQDQKAGLWLWGTLRTKRRQRKKESEWLVDGRGFTYITSGNTH